MNFPDGVYFGMDEETYHKVQRFSSSGVKDMKVSELDFWTNSWMNPDPPKPKDPDADYFKLKGRAYHCRLLEGPAEFHNRYYYSLDASSFKGRDILTSSADILGAIKALGLKGYSGKNKPELIEMLYEADRSVWVWDLMLVEHANRNVGRTMIPFDWRVDIERGAAMIEKHPTLSQALAGGEPEVTVLWTKELVDTDGSGQVHKIPMKCRIDKLKPQAIVDYKSFGNARKKPIRRAVIDAMAEYKNHIQVAVYYDACDHLPELFGHGKVFDMIPSVDAGQCVPEPVEPGTYEPLATPDKSFFFIYQKTGPAPLAVGRMMPRELTMVDIGRIEYEQAALTFAKCLQHFGTDMWMVPAELEVFDDESFPAWMSY